MYGFTCYGGGRGRDESVPVHYETEEVEEETSV